MTLRFPIPAPRSDEGTILPAILLAVLVLLAVLQLWLTGAVSPLPVVDTVRQKISYAAPNIVQVSVPPSINGRPIFSPGRTMTGSGAGSQGLDGVQVAGAVSIGRRTRLLLRRADGLMINLYPGEVFDGWRLLGATADGARFARDGQSMTIPFGASAPIAASTSTASSESEE